MPTAATWLAFAAVAFAMVLSPGPNMAYLISRSICQGPRAGLISLAGVLVGFAAYAALAAFGITALFVAVPYAYDTLRVAGDGGDEEAGSHRGGPPESDGRAGT